MVSWSALGALFLRKILGSLLARSPDDQIGVSLCEFQVALIVGESLLQSRGLIGGHIRDDIATGLPSLVIVVAAIAHRAELSPLHLLDLPNLFQNFFGA